MKLSTKQQWEERRSKQDKARLSFNPWQPMFRERHKLFKKYIPRVEKGTMLEVGAYPGTYLRYFYEYFGYTPWGVEYVESSAKKAVSLLKAEGVPGVILNRDFFELKLSEAPTAEGWDLTVSFGFVEHFDDSKDAVEKHIAVTRPGGLVIISIPNHAGFQGWIMKKVDRNKWNQHNKMSLEDLEDAVQRAGDGEIVFSGYVGRIGFWAAGLYELVRTRYSNFYPLMRAPLWLIEKIGQWIVPNNRWTSPDAVVILRKITA